MLEYNTSIKTVVLKQTDKKIQASNTLSKIKSYIKTYLFTTDFH